MSDSTVITTTSSGQVATGTGAHLVTQIARIVGGESDTPIRGQALDCLNRTRIEINQHDWTFMKRTDDPITLADGAATYSLESTFRKPSHCYLIDASGVAKFDLRYYDEEQYAHINPDREPTGQPVFYLLRNDFEDGLVTLYPTPDQSTAADFRLSVEYFASIGEFSDTNEADVALPEIVANCLVAGGQYYILSEREHSSPLVPFKFQDYQRTKRLLMTADRRVVDERPRFTLQPRRTRWWNPEP